MGVLFLYLYLTFLISLLSRDFRTLRFVFGLYLDVLARGDAVTRRLKL